MIPNRRRAVASLALALTLAFAGGCSAPGRHAAVAAFDPDSVPEAYARSTATLAWPGATRAFQVTPEGDLYNGDWRVHVLASAGRDTAAPPRAIAFEDRWRPIAHWTRRSGAVRWAFEAVAFPEPKTSGHRDSGLVASVEIRATNTGTTAIGAALRLTLASGGAADAFVAWDAPEVPDAFQWCSSATGRPVHGWIAHGADGGAARVEWTLAPGETRSERVVIPAYPTRGAVLVAMSRTPHARRVADARAYWDGEVARGARFDLGDAEVENALRAARVVLLECRERRGAYWVPIGNPLQYRDVWLRDGARAIAALAVTGYTADARALASGLAQYQWPQGALISQRGQLDGTGQALWAFEQSWLRPPAPPDSLARFTAAAIRAWRWSEEQRHLTQGTQGASGAFAAMLPAVNPRDNENVLAQLVGNDAWTIAGYRAASRLARASGQAAVADSIAAARAIYRADFAAALARGRFADIPPSWQGIGRDWGNLAVSWPCDVLDAADPRCAALARRMWAVSGGAGLVSYLHADTLHYYLGADLATWALLAGRRAAADSVLDAMLHWRSASGGAAELFARASGDWGMNPPPHSTSAAALVSVVRNALVFDDGDTLRLTLGSRERWWRGARVHGAPTRWGLLDLEFARAGNHARWAWTAMPVWTSLALPPGTRLAVAPPAPLRRGSRDASVLAPPGASAATVDVVEAR